MREPPWGVLGLRGPLRSSACRLPLLPVPVSEGTGSIRAGHRELLLLGSEAWGSGWLKASQPSRASQSSRARWPDGLVPVLPQWPC